MKRQTDASGLRVEHVYKSDNKTDRKKNFNCCMEKVIARFLSKTAHAPRHDS